MLKPMTEKEKKKKKRLGRKKEIKTAKGCWSVQLYED